MRRSCSVQNQLKLAACCCRLPKLQLTSSSGVTRSSHSQRRPLLGCCSASTHRMPFASLLLPFLSSVMAPTRKRAAPERTTQATAAAVKREASEDEQPEEKETEEEEEDEEMQEMREQERQEREKRELLRCEAVYEVTVQHWGAHGGAVTINRSTGESNEPGGTQAPTALLDGQSWRQCVGALKEQLSRQYRPYRGWQGDQVRVVETAGNDFTTLFVRGKVNTGYAVGYIKGKLGDNSFVKWQQVQDVSRS